MHNEWTYMDDEGTTWLDLSTDGESESVLPVDTVVYGRRWGQDVDNGWGYDDVE